MNDILVIVIFAKIDYKYRISCQLSGNDYLKLPLTSRFPNIADKPEELVK
jgi:hypothetical protein